jgi:hypothetical protein
LEAVGKQILLPRGFPADAPAALVEGDYRSPAQALGNFFQRFQGLALSEKA